jgi:hypothetical protein
VAGWNIAGRSSRRLGVRWPDRSRPELIGVVRSLAMPVAAEGRVGDSHLVIAWTGSGRARASALATSDSSRRVRSACANAPSRRLDPPSTADARPELPSSSRPRSQSGVLGGFGFSAVGGIALTFAASFAAIAASASAGTGLTCRPPADGMVL